MTYFYLEEENKKNSLPLPPPPNPSSSSSFSKTKTNMSEKCLDDLLTKYNNISPEIILSIIEQCQGNLLQAEQHLEELCQPTTTTTTTNNNTISIDTQYDSLSSPSPSTNDSCQLSHSSPIQSQLPLQEESPAILVSLIRTTLQDFLPEDATNQFLLHNFVNEKLVRSRLEFILKQIIEVISVVTSSEEEIEDNSFNESDDLIKKEQQFDENVTLKSCKRDLDDVIAQCDENLIPIDWSFVSVNIEEENPLGCEISLIDLLIFGDTLIQSSTFEKYNELDENINLIERVRKFLVSNSAPNYMLTDEAISFELEAHNFDLDSTIATLFMNLQHISQLNSTTNKSNRRGNNNRGGSNNGPRVKKNSGPRQKGIYIIYS